ncbi:hypothetical protein [Nocardia sp. CA-290969]|uniref:hypothetical protein n=1 Tax=Nocardia sp. CA-290969 TaxID=3239986 RepID=UPI003D920BCC
MGFDVRPVNFELYRLDAGQAWGYPPDEPWQVAEAELWAGSRDCHAPVVIEATAGEVALWSRAEVRARRGLGEAAARLLRDHGLHIAEANGWVSVQRVIGWRAAGRRLNYRGLRRSFVEFRERVRYLDEEYRPVREAIAARLQEREARRRAAARESAERSARELERIRAVSAAARWSYRIDEQERVVHVFHADDSSLSTRALAEKLQETYGRAGGYTVGWDDNDRREIERETGVTFEFWWRAVTASRWADSRHIPSPRSANRHTTAHTGFGIDSGSGGHGCGGGF